MTSVLTRGVARLLLPASLVAALAVLAKSYDDTGDGFSAGVIAATGIVVQYLAFGPEQVERLLPVRWAPPAVPVGVALALAVVFAPLLAGAPPVTHWPPPGAAVAHVGGLTLHTALLFDLGVFLVVLGFTVSVVRAVAHTRRREAP
jgi:multisubunit Na+/H+ antiporter MnhB subunit